MITDIRSLSQQLANPQFESAKELVRWMGAIQAQNYNMAKWAIGIRLKSCSAQQIEEALERGDILRTHIMRPTWHFVAAEDIRWMLQLSAHRIKAAYNNYARQLEITENMHSKCQKLLEEILKGARHLTKAEITIELAKAGFPNDTPYVNSFLMRAEITGLICSGADKNKKQTYALLEERAPQAKELHKEEALAELALRYFGSHSPASLQDFTWWSGLSVTEARHAVHLIDEKLIKDRYASQNLLIHQAWGNSSTPGDVFHLLPSFDEYLISYKDRTAALDPELNHKAFTNNGIFHPVIMYRGRIAGSWKKVTNKGQTRIETSFFEKKIKIDKELQKEAEAKYLGYLSKP